MSSEKELFVLRKNDVGDDGRTSFRASRVLRLVAIDEEGNESVLAEPGTDLQPAEDFYAFVVSDGDDGQFVNSIDFSCDGPGESENEAGEPDHRLTVPSIVEADEAVSPEQVGSNLPPVVA